MLVVIGYSVPVTDQLSQALLRADVNKLRALVVVNPDPQARRRVIEVISSGSEPNATVVELQTIEDFASYLAPTDAEPAPVDPVDLLAELRRLRAQVRGISGRLRELNQAQIDLKESQKTLEEEQEALKDTIQEMQSAVGDLRRS